MKNIESRKEKDGHDRNDSKICIRKFLSRTVFQFAKVYGTVYAIQRALALLFRLPKLLKQRQPLSHIQNLLLSRDSHDLALATSTSCALAVAVKSPLLQHLTGLSRLYQSMLAGLVSSFGIFLDRNAERRRSIIVTLFIRAMYFVSRGVVYEAHSTSSVEKHPKNSSLKVRPYLVSPACPAFIRYMVRLYDQFGDILAWNMYSFYICYVSYAMPDLLTPSYFKSLLFVTGNYFRFGKKHTLHMTRAAGELSKQLSQLSYEEQQKQPWKLPDGITSREHLINWIQKAKEGNSGHPNVSLLKALANLEPGLNVLPSNHRHTYLACLALHPGEEKCYHAHLRLMGLSFLQVFRSYLFLNGILTLVSIARKADIRKMRTEMSKEDIRHYKESMAKHLRRYFMSTFRSSATIGVFVYLMAAGVCGIRWAFNREFLLSYGIAGWLASFAIFIENRSRLPELNAYCGIQVLSGLQSYLKLKYNWIPPLYLEWSIFATSWTSLLALHFNHDLAIQGIVRPMLNFLVGLPHRHALQNP